MKRIQFPDSLLWIVFFFFFIAVLSCTRKSDSLCHEIPEGETLTHYAKFLNLKDLGNGMIEADVVNPWKDDEYLVRYLLVDSTVDASELESYKNFEIVRTPIKSALVYSSVHTSPLIELGASSVIAGVADAEYFKSTHIRQGINSGKIIDVGNSMSPSFEKIVELSPQVAIVSPYENSGHGILDKVGTTVIDMADYMEPTPVARAEWILLLGALSGHIEQAKAYFAEVETAYSEIKDSVADVNDRPRVLMELPYSGVWYQPGGNSYMAKMIYDAGAQVLYPSDASSGSLQLDIASVFENGNDADIWLIKSVSNLMRKDISDVVPIAGEFKAFKNDNVWYSNTTESALYDDLAFKPHLVLREYAEIFHPERYNSQQGRYFKRMGE